MNRDSLYTIKGRIDEARKATALITAGVRVLGQDEDDDESVQKELLVEAMLSTMEALDGHLYWLTCLPMTVLGAPSPTDDEARTDEKKRTMVEGVIKRLLAEAPDGASS